LKSSYFSSLFAASKSFPNHIGLASGTSMALFGLSPLFFSVIASTFFSDPATEALNVTHYTRFLAIFNSIAYVGGFFFLQQIPRNVNCVERTETQSDSVTQAVNEDSPLLAVSRIKPADPTISELLRLPEFWLLGIFGVLTLGLVRVL